MPELAFPSEIAPPPPQITVTLPEDWSPLPAGAGLLTAVGPDHATNGSGRQPQLCVEVLTYPEGEGQNSALAAAEEALAGAEALESDPAFEVEIAGHPFVGVNHSWLVQDAPYVQVVLVGVFSHGPVDQVVRMSGSVGGAFVDEDYAAVQTIVESAVIEAADAEATSR